MLRKRYCEIQKEDEVSDLEQGMDFRLPRYRREVFLRFYEAHLRTRAHPGCVYYVFPYLAETHGWTMEERLWFAYINGNTQNPVTSWLIWRAFPKLQDVNASALMLWFAENYARLQFDTDRRYFKKFFPVAVENYRRLVGDGTQEAFFQATGWEGAENFRRLWVKLNREFVYFGRLSLFSYLEYLRMMGLEVECDRLFLGDMAGSKSHRNGLCEVLGRDDLDWHESNPGFTGDYGAGTIDWLTEEAAQLLAEAKARWAGRPYARDVGYFTLESAFCTYKSWHRPNRRYPNVYNDMFVDRIRTAEAVWGPLPVFWEARGSTLDPSLRVECNPADPGVKPVKQNHYRLTGEVIMMDVGCGGWPCFKNRFNDDVREKQRGRG